MTRPGADLRGESGEWLRPGLALICALAGVAVFQFFGNANRGYIDSASLFYWWGVQWFNADSETQHGILILALSGWLFSRNLRKVSGRELEASAGENAPTFRQLAPLHPWITVLAMVGGLGLHAIGFAAQQARLSIGALLLFTWGVMRLAGGRRWSAAAAFPLAFMVFAVPVNVLDSLGFWLRLWVIDATEVLARIGGIEVVRSGTQLFAKDGRYQYDVAAACSGVRSLMALAALTLLLGYLSFRSSWRRLAILALCFPLTYLGNLVRIAGVILAAEWFGQAAGERVHEWAGFLVFVIVLGGAWAAVHLWKRGWPENGVDHSRADETAELVGQRRKGKLSAGFFGPVTVASLVVLLAVGEMIFLYWLRSLPPRGGAGVVLAPDGLSPVALPAFIGTEWVGRDVAVTKVERDILPADTGFSRKLYLALAEPEQQVFVSVVLSGRDRTSIHRPELCLVGQGLTIESTTQREFDFGSDEGADFRATVLRGHREVMARSGTVRVPELVVYWFVGNGGVEATHGGRVWRDAWNRVVHARVDRWAYVLVQTGAADGEAAALARVQAVMNGAWPRLQKPGNVP